MIDNSVLLYVLLIFFVTYTFFLYIHRIHKRFRFRFVRLTEFRLGRVRVVYILHYDMRNVTSFSSLVVDKLCDFNLTSQREFLMMT